MPETIGTAGGDVVIAGGLTVDDWCAAIEAVGFDDVSVGLALDASGGADAYDVAAHVLLPHRPSNATTIW